MGWEVIGSKNITQINRSSPSVMTEITKDLIDQNQSHVSACNRKIVPTRWKLPTGRPELKAVTGFCCFNSKS